MPAPAAPAAGALLRPRRGCFAPFVTFPHTSCPTRGLRG
ncbi:hypothetical protein BEI_0197 [Halomonas beimenensis]|uniref:Uncharacterized protein n=1 Tax=Halomonas beimenensis TaxID=475662 RepID=A0A291P2S4_9GAMM|nr:hypothetical protein BEI_0197 [Halomonas beimenensis]